MYQEMTPTKVLRERGFDARYIRGESLRGTRLVDLARCGRSADRTAGNTRRRRVRAWSPHG